MILGSGIWFEPYVYDKNEEYVGPYIYKEGGTVLTTYDYSNAEYDYFNQPYYLNAKASEKKAQITQPYYDETLDMIMASCWAPFFNEKGEFAGGVTITLSMSGIQNAVSDIQIGETGEAFLINSVRNPI